MLTFGWQVIPHPPYSPDLAPSDYWLFSDLQRFLDEREFSDDDAIRAALTEYFASKPKSFYAAGIERLPGRWREVVNSDGDYV